MATITISSKITDEMQVHLLKNINEMAERNLIASVNGYPLSYKIDPKKETENDLQFAKRVINEIVLRTVKANALYTDRLRKNAEVDAITDISENIPDKLLT